MDGDICFMEGRGVAQIDAKAVQWLRQSAEQGLAEAQFRLGYMFENSRGVALSYEEAACWYIKAAEQGYDMAQYFLAEAIASGRGVEKSNVEAKKWYKKAAAQGIVNPMSKVLLMAHRGHHTSAQKSMEAVSLMMKSLGFSSSKRT